MILRNIIDSFFFAVHGRTDSLAVRFSETTRGASGGRLTVDINDTETSVTTIPWFLNLMK